MACRGRITARPTNGVSAVDQYSHLGGQLGVFHARLGQELLYESLARPQVRKRGLMNGMPGAVDLEAWVDERAPTLRSGFKGVLDNVEEREDHQLAGLLGTAPRV